MEDDMRLALLCLLLVSGRAFAADVLIEHVSKGATPEAVVAIIKQALTGRGWTIEASTPESVTAIIDRRPATFSRMTISIDGQSLVFEGHTSVRANVGSANAPVRYNKPLSSLWVGNLRHDIGLTLATISDR
jgi:hypothetical protein